MSSRFAIYNVIAPVLGLFGAVSVTAQPTVSMPACTAGVGESMITILSLDSQQSEISGIQFDIEWDAATMNLIAVAGVNARGANKKINQIDLSSGKKRFLIFGFNQTSIQSGELVELFFNLQDQMSAEIHIVKVTNVIATNRLGDIIDANGIDGTITVQANNAKGAKLKPGGVRNAGSLLPGAVSAGEVITIFGSGIGPSIEQFPSPSSPTPNLGITTLLFDGTPVPLLYAGIDQINAVVPFHVSDKTFTQVQVLKDNRVLAEATIPVISSTPAIFTQSADGLGPATILNENTTLNSVDNPAELGKVITLFATGAGLLGPSRQDGEVVSDDGQHPLLSLSVAIDGIDAEVLSAESAPFSVTGVVQVKCRVPVHLKTGPAVPIVLSIGTEKSQAGVTISIQ